MQKHTSSLARFVSTASLATMALAMIAPSARAEAGRAEAARVEPATIRVVGEATVTSAPDQAEIDIGVVTRANSSQQAAEENARLVRNVLAALRSALGRTAQVETISYSLYPEYRYPEGGGQPTITGYTAINVVRVTLDDLSKVGLAIDTATQAGANQIDRIRFLLKDEDAAQARALRMAALDAREKANGLAATLGLRVMRILSVDEAAPMPRPLYDVEFRAAAATPTAIIPREIETTARVTLAIEVEGGR